MSKDHFIILWMVLFFYLLSPLNSPWRFVHKTHSTFFALKNIPYHASRPLRVTLEDCKFLKDSVEAYQKSIDGKDYIKMQKY